MQLSSFKLQLIFELAHLQNLNSIFRSFLICEIWSPNLTWSKCPLYGSTYDKNKQKQTFDLTLAGVPDLLRCIVLWLSLPGDSDGGIRSVKSDTDGWRPPEDELGEGLRDRKRIGVSPDVVRFKILSFSSMILAGDFMSTLGSPTDVNVGLAEDVFKVLCRCDKEAFLL
jgi:hypothetical protein